jgi:hypothetical protein
MRNTDNMNNRWNRRLVGSILSPNPAGMLVDIALRVIKYNRIKKQRNKSNG